MPLRSLRKVMKPLSDLEGRVPEAIAGPYNKFSDLGARQKKIMDFLEAVVEVEQSCNASKPREPYKANTPVSKKVKRFEDLSKEEMIRSPRLRSLKKVQEKKKGKVDNKVQLGRKL